MVFVGYSSLGIELEDALHDFVGEHFEMSLAHFTASLRVMVWCGSSTRWRVLMPTFSTALPSWPSLWEPCAERFCDGALLHFYWEGCILR